MLDACIVDSLILHMKTSQTIWGYVVLGFLNGKTQNNYIYGRVGLVGTLQSANRKDSATW